MLYVWVPFSESRSSHSGCLRRRGVASLLLGFPVLPLGCPCRCISPVAMSAINVMVPPRHIHRCIVGILPMSQLDCPCRLGVLHAVKLPCPSQCSPRCRWSNFALAVLFRPCGVRQVRVGAASLTVSPRRYEGHGAQIRVSERE
jgi:hypothetical protein